MHYADFAEDEVAASVSFGEYDLLIYLQEKALLQAIKEYEASKWKVIGSKVGKPAKV